MTQVFPYGGVEVMHQEKETFKINGQRLKPYFGRDFNAHYEKKCSWGVAIENFQFELVFAFGRH